MQRGLATSSPSLRQAPLETSRENEFQKSKIQLNEFAQLSLPLVNQESSFLELKSYYSMGGEEFQRGGSINQRDHRGEHSSIISESRLMKIERKGGENPWRDIARRFIIGELRSSYKNLANSRDVTSERKGKVRVIDKVSNVTLKYRSGERGEKGLAVMVVVVVVVRRAPGFQTFSRDRYQAG